MAAEKVHMRGGLSTRELNMNEVQAFPSKGLGNCTEINTIWLTELRQVEAPTLTLIDILSDRVTSNVKEG